MVDGGGLDGHGGERSPVGANLSSSRGKRQPVAAGSVNPSRRSTARVMVVIGTRPEAIKMAPVVRELARDPAIVTRLVVTGQHRELLDPVLELFDLRPDRRLEAMVHGQTLSGLTARLFELLDPVVADERPDWMLVQGDTATTMTASLVAFYHGVAVGHIEAGLRTSDLRQPFPEECNRRIADLCAACCFAPTVAARDNLVAEGVPASRVHVTGNTIVDAVLDIAARPYDERLGPLAGLPRDRRWVLVTAHRRESFGPPLERICAAVRRLIDHFGRAIHVIAPVHPNPNVYATMTRLLAGPDCSVLSALGYRDLVYVLSRASLVMTDSGGIQEEAPTFGVPVLVLRDRTERQEGIAAGIARLVGTDPDVIVLEAIAALDGAASTRPAANPYGDGRAARRIVSILRRELALSSERDEEQTSPSEPKVSR